ncbi:unnamed protein product [Closterium sp. Naga37s-1]|nr:unnamed protein product [Closterium sp. Naga37s-1]
MRPTNRRRCMGRGDRVGRRKHLAHLRLADLSLADLRLAHLRLSHPPPLSSSASLILRLSHPPPLSSSASLTLSLSHPPPLSPSASLTLRFSHPPLLLPSASLTLRLSHPPPLSPSASLTLRLSHPPPLSPFASLTLRLSHPPPLSPSASLTLRFSHPPLLSPSASLTSASLILRLSHGEMHRQGGGFGMGRCIDRGVAWGWGDASTGGLLGDGEMHRQGGSLGMGRGIDRVDASSSLPSSRPLPAILPSPHPLSILSPFPFPSPTLLLPSSHPPILPFFLPPSLPPIYPTSSSPTPFLSSSIPSPNSLAQCLSLLSPPLQPLFIFPPLPPFLWSEEGIWQNKRGVEVEVQKGMYGRSGQGRGVSKGGKGVSRVEKGLGKDRAVVREREVRGGSGGLALVKGRITVRGGVGEWTGGIGGRVEHFNPSRVGVGEGIGSGREGNGRVDGKGLEECGETKAGCEGVEEEWSAVEAGAVRRRRKRGAARVAEVVVSEDARR